MEDKIAILTSIPGIGEKTYDKYLPFIQGAKPTQISIRKALRKHLADLPAITRADITLNPLRKVPRSMIEYVANILGDDVFVGGSFIRGKPTSGDMDILIYAKDWDKIYTKFRNSDIIIREPFAHGESKIGTIITVKIPINITNDVIEYLQPHNYYSNGKINIKVDFFLANKQNYITTKLFVIGSGKFNIFMRSQAKKHGYLLNNDGLFKDGKLVPVKNEKEIFKILGIRYREYTERN